MSLENKFNEYVFEWKKHCELPKVSISSNPIMYINCDAYKNIVDMGYKALPFIKKTYEGSDEDAFFPIFGWASSVKEIIGENFEIPQDIKGKVREIRDYTVSWLEENIKK